MNRQSSTRQPAGRGTARRLGLGIAALAAASGTLAVASVAPTGAATATTVKFATHAGLGKILVDGTGMAVYIFTADGANKPTCTGGCASVWPPVTVPKGTKPRGGHGVKGLGTVVSGGKLQVTWNKHPLYTYALDTGPGVVHGNGVKEGSGTWFAATTSKVASAGTATTTQSSQPTGGYGY